MAKQEGKDKLAKIHGYLVSTYDKTPTDYNTFKELMADEAYAEKIHKALIADEDVEITSDYNTFADNYGLKKKAVTPTSATTSKPAISSGQVTSQEQVEVQPPTRRFTLQEKGLPTDNTAVAPPVEQLLPAEKAKREEARKVKSREVEQKAYETVKKLKDIQFKKNNNIPVDPKTVPTRDELQQSEIDLEAANIGTEQDKQLIRTALGDTGQSQGSDLVNRFFKGVVQLVPDASNTIAIMAKGIDKNLLGVDKPLTDYQTRQWGIAAQELIDKNLVTNQYFDDDDLSMLSQGLGQVASTVALAAATRGASAEAQALRCTATLPEVALAAAKNTAGLRTATKEILRREAPKAAAKLYGEQSLTKTAVELLGKSTKQIAAEAAAGVPAKLLNPSSLAAGAQVFASTFDEATKAGADFDTAFKVSAKNAGLTTTLAILPMEAILKSAEGIGKISLKEYTKNAVKAAGTEGLTEGFEQYYANLNAQETYDLNRKLMDGVLLNAKAGGAIGGFLSAFLGIRNLSLSKANETNDARLKQQAEEFNRILPKELGAETTTREEVSVTNSGNQRDRAKAELMPNVPIPTQQVLGNTPSITAPIIDTTQQPVEVDPVEAAENLISNADVSGNETSVILAGEAADKIIAAVDSVEQKPATKIIRRKRAGEKDEYVEVDANYQLTANEKNIGTEEQNLIDNGVIDVTRIEQPTTETPVAPAPVIELVQPVEEVPTPTEEAPVEQATPTEEAKPAKPILTQEELDAAGISTEPITSGERDAPTLEGIYVTPKKNAQVLFVSRKSNDALMKQPDGTLTSTGRTSVNDLLIEAAEVEPEIFDTGDRTDVNTDDIQYDEEVFETLRRSNNPLELATAFLEAAMLGFDRMVSNTGSPQQVLSQLIYRLTPDDVLRYGKASIEEYPTWLQTIIKKNAGKKSTIDSDAETPEQSDLSFTTDDVLEHLDALAIMEPAQGKKQFEEWLSDEEVEVNTRTEEIAERFKDITGATLTPELAETIEASNPIKEKFVTGVDEEGNLIKTPSRDYVLKPETAPETDKYAGLTKKEAQKKKRKDKITQRAEKIANEKLDALAAVTTKSDIQTALDKIKDLWKNGGIMPVTLNMGGSPMLTPQAKAAFSELIRAIKASGAKKVKDIAQQLYDIIPDNIKGNTNAVDFEPLVEEVIAETGSKELAEATNSLVKLFKQEAQTTVFEKGEVYKFVKDKITKAIGKLDVATNIEIEKLIDNALTVKQKNRFDTALTGKRKTTKQVLGIPINPVLQKLIEIGKVIVNYVPYGREKGFTDARAFIEESSMEEILEYLDKQSNDDKYTYVAKIMEDHIIDLMAQSNSLAEKAQLEEVYARIYNNRKEKISNAARTLKTGEIFKEALDSPEELAEVQVRLDNARKLNQKIEKNNERKKVEELKADAAAQLKETQRQFEENEKEAKRDALFETLKKSNRTLRFDIAQAKIEIEGLRKTTPESIDELISENNKLAKALRERPKKGKANTQTKASATKPSAKKKEVATKATVRKEIGSKLFDLAFNGKVFEQTTNMFGSFSLRPEFRKTLNEYVKALKEEGIVRVEAIAESIYNLLPQAIQDTTSVKDWERIVAEIEGEAYEETVGAGIDALNERIDKDIQERILKGDQKPKDAVEDVIAELYKIYREKTIASDRKPIQPKTANELIAELLSQGEQAKTVWTEVQNKIFEKYGKDQKVLDALAEYFAETPLQLPVSKKKVKQAVREYFQNRGATLEELIRDRVRIEEETGANTRQAILALMPDLPTDLVNDIVNTIANEAGEQAKVTAEKIIDRYFEDTVTSNRKPKPIKEQMLSDIALARYADKNRVIAGINKKYGTDIQTVEELTDLENALDAATTDTQVREALTDFARWTPEGAKLAGRISKTEADRLGETESNAGLDPVQLTLKALHDVAKQNKEVVAATAKKPANVIDTMRAVLGMQNSGDAARIWETAKAIVNRQLEENYKKNIDKIKEQFKDDLAAQADAIRSEAQKLDEARQQIQEYFGHTPLQMAIPKKDFKKAVNQRLKEILGDKTIEQAVLDFDNIKEQVSVSLTEMLTQGFNLDPAYAAELANQVEAAAQERLTKVAQKLAKGLEKRLPKKRADRVPLAVRIAQAIALKEQGAEDIERLIEERYGVTLTDTELSALAITAKEAAVAFKKGGKDSVVYKAKAKLFEDEIAKADQAKRGALPWYKKLFNREQNRLTVSASILADTVGRTFDAASNSLTTIVEILKTAGEIPLNLSKADWRRFKAKLLNQAKPLIEGYLQGRRIADLQMKGKITDTNRYTAQDKRSAESLVVGVLAGNPNAFIKYRVNLARFVYRVMAATDSLFTSEIAYQKALFDLLVSTNPDKSLRSAEVAKQAYDLMYGDAIKQLDAARDAFSEVYGRVPTSNTVEGIKNEAKAIDKKQYGIFNARVIEILQGEIDDDIRNEARRVANIQAYKGEQFGLLGLAIDGINRLPIAQNLVGDYLLRFTGTAIKILNQSLDYSPYGFIRAANKGLSKIFIDASDATNGRVLGTRTEVYDPQKTMPEDTKKAIETALRRQQFGRALVGTTVLNFLIPSIFAALGDEDDPTKNEFDIIGSMESYPKAYRDALKQIGVKPNSIKIGNLYIPFELLPAMLIGNSLISNYKDAQRAASILNASNPEKYKLTREGVDKWYEYIYAAYGLQNVSGTAYSIAGSTPIKALPEAVSNVMDKLEEGGKEGTITESERGEVLDFTDKVAAFGARQLAFTVLPKEALNVSKYTVETLDKNDTFGALAMNNDPRAEYIMAYAFGLGEVLTASKVLDPRRKIDAFGNVFEKQPNEKKLPMDAFERKWKTDPLIQLQIASGVVKLPKTSGTYLNSEGKKTPMNPEQLYKMNLTAGKLAKERYEPKFIQEDMALLETDRPKAVERIKKTSAAVLEYARLQYLYDNFSYEALRKTLPKGEKPPRLIEAERAIYKARNTK